MIRFEELQRNDLISLSASDVIRGRYTIRIKPLTTLITIELKQSNSTTRTKYESTHAIKTPMMNRPYVTDVPYGADPHHALVRAISDLTDHYRSAIKAGYKPNESWLVRLKW